MSGKSVFKQASGWECRCVWQNFCICTTLTQSISFTSHRHKANRWKLCLYSKQRYRQWNGNFFSANLQHERKTLQIKNALKRLFVCLFAFLFAFKRLSLFSMLLNQKEVFLSRSCKCMHLTQRFRYSGFNDSASATVERRRERGCLGISLNRPSKRK